MRIISSTDTNFLGHSLKWERNFLYLFIVTSGFFIIFPQIDLIVSSYFYRSGAFVISSDPYLIALRDFHRAMTVYCLPFLIVILISYAVWRYPLPEIAPHKILFIALTFVLGPGVIVQGLKHVIGRSRPRHLLEFGGAMDFTPAWQLASACQRNCSFPSGEGSSAAAILSLLVLVPARYRVFAAVIVVPYLMLVSLNRVFMGAHFLSDVIIAWTLVIGLMLWLWTRITPHAETIDNWVWRRGDGVRKRLYSEG